VGLADLETIDVTSGQNDQALWIVEELGWPPEQEALEYVQLIIKLAGVLEHARLLLEDGKRSTVLLHGPAEPPASVLQYLTDRQVASTVGSTTSLRPATGRPSRFPNLHDGSPDLEALQSANAAAFAATHGLDGSVASLSQADEIVEARRDDHGLAPYDVDEEFTDGNLIVLAGAYAGEVLRHHSRDGLWWLGPSGHSDPLHLRVGLGHGTRVNVLGAVRKHLSHGSGESLYKLVDSALSRLG
jgi:hypothetical protein